MLHGTAARVERPSRPGRSAARRGAGSDHALARRVVGVALEPQHQVDAVDRERAARRPTRASRRARTRAARRPSRRAGTGTRRSAAQGPASVLRTAAAAGRTRRTEHAELGELVLQRDRVGDGGLRMVGHRDHGVLFEELIDAAGGVHHTRELQVGLADRVDLRVGAALVRVPVVVGQRQQQEVEQVVLDHVRGHAPGVPVAHAGHAERRAAAGAPRGEDVGVEQLARAHHRMAHERRGDARQGGVALRLVAVAASIHQIGGARRCARRRRRASRTPSASASERCARFML